MVTVTVKPKTMVRYKLDAVCPSHSRTDVSVRDVKVTIDEPIERGGTNMGPTPTETMMVALIGCTNVIAHRVAEKNGVHFKSMKIRLEADFDRRGTQFIEEINIPFPEITMFIDVQTDTDEQTLAKVKRELGMYCPVSKVFRQAGTKVNEVWNVSR